MKADTLVLMKAQKGVVIGKRRSRTKVQSWLYV